MLHKAWNSKGEMPYCFPRSSIKFQGHTGQNITDFDPNWAFPDYRPVAAFKSLRFALLFYVWNNCRILSIIQIQNVYDYITMIKETHISLPNSYDTDASILCCSAKRDVHM